VRLVGRLDSGGATAIAASTPTDVGDGDLALDRAAMEAGTD
jgi:hypothetical protein